jgi:hypothetical protein
MIQAVSTLAIKPDQLPGDLFPTLLKTLVELQQVLIKVASPQSVENLNKQYSLLRKSINSRMEENPTNTWSLPLLRLIAGGSQLNQAVKDARELESSREIPVPLKAVQPVRPGSGEDKKQALIVPKTQAPGGLGRISLSTLHSTTTLGLQALLAVLLAC